MMNEERKKNLIGILLGLLRGYFVYRLKNIRHLPLFKPTKLPEKTNE